MADQKNSNPLLTIIAILAFVVFIYMGIQLMVKSNAIYNYSVQLTEKTMNAPQGKQWQIVQPGYTIVRDGYGQALSYFMLALGVLLLIFLLPRLQNLSISPSGVNITLKDLQQTVDTLISQTNTIQSNSVGEGGRKASGNSNMEIAGPMSVETPKYPDDPQKGKWGEKAEDKFRRMSATVTDSFLPNFYVVEITVENTNDNFPLKGVVKFHLHETFLNPDPVIAVKNGKAILKLTKVWGAFTVGAEADDGQTRLELDLAELKEAPKKFRER